MLKGISRFIQKQIFSFVGTIRTIALLKTSKEYINKLDFKQCINMYNFCKIYYENDNIKPSLYILLRNFSSTISKNNFVEIYTYFINNYIKDNPNESIELDLLLDKDIVLEILNKNLLKTNKIELIISSLNILFNQNLNFRNKTNIEKIYFKIIDKNKNRNRDYNQIYINFEEYDRAFDYLIFLIYFKRLIPESISQIGFSSLLNDSNLSKEKINILINEKLGIGNKNIYNEKSNLDSYKLYMLIFDELSQYKNIKEFTFNSHDVDDYFKILKNENKFLNNLTKINLDIYNLLNQENIYTLKNLIQTNHLKNKLKIDIKISLDFYLKLKELLNEEINENILNFCTFSNFNYKTHNHKIKYFLPNNIKLSFLNDLIFFYDYSNLEILHLSTISLDKNYDYDIFSNLPNLKELKSFELEFKNENTLNNLFKTLNKYNQELKILDIKYFNIDELNDDKIDKGINLNVDLELKNLENLSINYNDSAKIKNKKINVLNIDKCEKLKEIKTSYDFQCQNPKVLNNIENIYIRIFESNNDYFLRTIILKCKNLKKLYINFLLPFNMKLISTLYNNIGKIRHLEIDYWFYEENQEIFDEMDKKEYIKYENELKKIIKFKKFGWNFLEKSYVFNDEYYKEFNNLKYEDKINKLKNFPILEIYGYFSLEHDYKFNKIDLDKEKEIFLEYLNYEENLSEHSYYKFKK